MLIPRPFFIVGAQRSGTTLLRLMLDCHSRLCVPFESVFIPEFYNRLSEFGDLSCPSNIDRLVHEIGKHRFVIKGKLLPNPELVQRFSPKSYSEVVEAIFRVVAEQQRKIRWGDKTPGYITEIHILRKLFPNAQFIHLVRDGRDVALSLRRVRWGSKHLPAAARDWKRKTELAHKVGAMMPNDFLEIRYEDLVLNPENTLKMVCCFLGESFEEQMLRHYELGGSGMPKDSLVWHEASISPIDENKVGAWRSEMSIADQQIFQEIAGEDLVRFGYDVLDYPRTLRVRAKSLYYRLWERC